MAAMIRFACALADGVALSLGGRDPALQPRAAQGGLRMSAKFRAEHNHRDHRTVNLDGDRVRVEASKQRRTLPVLGELIEDMRVAMLTTIDATAH